MSAFLRCGVLCSRRTRPYLARREFQPPPPPLPPGDPSSSFGATPKNSPANSTGIRFPGINLVLLPSAPFEGKFEGRRSFFYINLKLRSINSLVIDALLRPHSILSRWILNMAIKEGGLIKNFMIVSNKIFFRRGKIKEERLKRWWKF